MNTADAIRRPMSFFETIAQNFQKKTSLTATFFQQNIQQSTSEKPDFTISSISKMDEGELNEIWQSCIWQSCLDSFMETFEKQAPEHSIPLKQVFEKLSLENLAEFFERSGEFYASKPQTQIDEILSQAISFDALLQVIQKKHGLDENALKEWLDDIASIWSEQADPRPEAPNPPPQKGPHTLISRFFPNLGNALLKAFSLFDSSNAPSSLYEYGVLVTLYFHFFMIPFAIFEILLAVFASPLGALIAAIIIIGIAIGALYVYLRWIKKCPEEVQFCINLSKKQQQGELENVLCRDKEYGQVSGLLGSGKNILLIGPPGVGKSEFLNGLPQRHPDKKVFIFDNARLFGDSGSITSASEKIEYAFKDVAGYEKEVLFCLDEMGDAFKSKPNDLIASIKTLNSRNVPFIAAVTTEQWEKIKCDQSIEQRFTPVQFEPTTPDETFIILNEKAEEYAENVSITAETLHITENQTSNVDLHAQPRHGVQTLKAKLNKHANFNPDAYVSDAWISASTVLRKLDIEAKALDSPLRNPGTEKYNAFKQRYREAEAKKLECEIALKIERENAKTLLSWEKAERRYWKLTKEAAAKIAQTVLESEKEIWKKKALVRQFFILDAIKKQIELSETTLSQELLSILKP